MLRLLPLAATAAVLAPLPAAAQETDEQLWTTTTAEMDLGHDLEGSAHLVARFGDAAGGVSQVQLGADLDYSVGDKVKLGAGYSYIPSYQDGTVTSREHRIRQQASVKLGSVAGGDLATRLRLEQRWRDDGDDVMLRLRPRLTWTRAIGPDGLALRLQHESFFNLNETDWGGDARFDRVRHQISLRRRLGGIASAEIGYLNQYGFGDHEPDEMVHALTVAVTFAL